MWKIYPVVIDFMNGKTMMWYPPKDIIDGLGLMNELSERITEAGESPPFLGMYRLFGGGGETLSPEEINTAMRKDGLIPEKWE